MSKAFTRENDDSETEVTIARTTLPAGVPNYLTSDGAIRLSARLTKLEDERRLLQAAHDEDAQKERLRRINTNLQTISQILTSATIVQPPEETTAEIRFGAFVTVRDETGAKLDYRIVGSDEVDPDNGCVSWLSPIARTLLGKTVGETISLKTVGGERKLTVLRVRYFEE